MAAAKPIGLRDVRALPPNGEVWDGGTEGVAGFGARRQRSEAVAYMLMYRTAGRAAQRRMTGNARHGAEPELPEA